MTTYTTTYTRTNLTPEDYRTYRLARFGEAGRCGKEGVAKAATQHGVAIRTWYTYESGSRKPNPAVSSAVARWLNRAERRAMQEAAAWVRATVRAAANVEVSLGRPAPSPLAPVEESTTHTVAPST